MYPKSRILGLWAASSTVNLWFMIRDVWQVTRSEEQFQTREVESRRVTEEFEKNLAVDKEEYGTDRKKQDGEDEYQKWGI
jgi:hypothetical protein